MHISPNNYWIVIDKYVLNNNHGHIEYYIINFVVCIACLSNSYHVIYVHVYPNNDWIMISNCVLNINFWYIKYFIRILLCRFTIYLFRLYHVLCVHVQLYIIQSVKMKKTTKTKDGKTHVKSSSKVTRSQSSRSRSSTSSSYEEGATGGSKGNEWSYIIIKYYYGVIHVCKIIPLAKVIFNKICSI